MSLSEFRGLSEYTRLHPIMEDDESSWYDWKRVDWVAKYEHKSIFGFASPW